MLFLNKNKESYLKKSDQITKEEENWEIEKENLKRQNVIRGEYKELTKSAPSKLSTSKKALIFLFINCSLIEIFTLWVTIKSVNLAMMMGISPDFTPLITLIGAVVSEVVGLAAYYVKSTKENISGGIVYESAAAANFQQPFDDGSVG